MLFRLGKTLHHSTEDSLRTLGTSDREQHSEMWNEIGGVCTVDSGGGVNVSTRREFSSQ